MPPASLSVIIPTYNSAKTLSVCLDSLVNQTFKDFEVLVVDGLSGDNTVAIVEQYAGIHENIRYVSEKDNGVYDAMNKGIKLAKSEWLYFMGSDDRLYSDDVFETILSGPNLNYDVIYGDVYSEMLGGVYDGEFTVEKIFSKNICHQAIFFKKNIFKLTGLFDTRYKAHADWDHNLKWLRDPQIHSVYVNKIVANFAAGGLSSHHKDDLFDHVVNWERAKHQKKGVSRLNRLRMVKASLRNALDDRSARFFFKIIAGAPSFVL